MTHNALSYILGFTLGDGITSKKGFLVRLYDQNYQFVQTTLKTEFTKSFGVEPGVSFDKSNNSCVLHKRSEEVWEKLHKLGVPAGRKARIIVIPDSIRSGDLATKSSFISGVFDAEGSITSYTEVDKHPRGYPYLEVKMYNPRFIDGLREQLLAVSDEFQPRTYHYNYGSILRLNGRRQLRLVWSHLQLMHPRFNPPAR